MSRRSVLSCFCFSNPCIRPERLCLLSSTSCSSAVAFQFPPGRRRVQSCQPYGFIRRSTDFLLFQKTYGFFLRIFKEFNDLRIFFDLRGKFLILIGRFWHFRRLCVLRLNVDGGLNDFRISGGVLFSFRFVCQPVRSGPFLSFHFPTTLSFHFRISCRCIAFASSIFEHRTKYQSNWQQTKLNFSKNLAIQGAVFERNFLPQINFKKLTVDLLQFVI